MEGPPSQERLTSPMTEASNLIFEEFRKSMLVLLGNLQGQLALQEEKFVAELEAERALRLAQLGDGAELHCKFEADAASPSDLGARDDSVPLEREDCSLPLAACSATACSAESAVPSSNLSLGTWPMQDSAHLNQAAEHELPRLLGGEGASSDLRSPRLGRTLPLGKVRPPAVQIPRQVNLASKALDESWSPAGNEATSPLFKSDHGVPPAPAGCASDCADDMADGGTGDAESGAESIAKSAAEHVPSASTVNSMSTEHPSKTEKPRRLSLVSLESIASGIRNQQYFPDPGKLRRSKSILRQFHGHMEGSVDGAVRQQLRVGDMLVQDGIVQRFVLNPSSRWRFGWDITGILLVGFDAMLIPMQVFELPEEPFLESVNWAITCFWTLDVAASFMTGYHTHGFLEMRPAMIAKRYLRTWLIPDLAVVTMDWTFIAVGLGDTAGVLRFGKSARALRILRAVRLLRLMKVIELMAKISDGLNSELLLMVMNILKLVVSVVILNHYIACLWFLITTLSEDEDANWAQVNGVEAADVGTQYGIALHWSLTQFMPASMEVNPTNSRERYFAILVLIFGLVTFSSFVSSITTVMAQLRNISSDRLSAEANLRQYLNENRVSVDLGIRIRQFFRENYEARRRRVHEVDVIFFDSLPETLKVELHKEVYMPVLTAHPVFYHYYSVDTPGMWLICHLTMSQQSYVAGHTIFLEGEPASEMLFVVTGNLKYFMSCQAIPWEVKAGAWLCEAALWCKNWEFCGRLAATSMCELYGIDAKKFRAITRERGPPFTYMRSYAKSFMQYVKESKESAQPVTDVCMDLQTVQDMVAKVFSTSEQATIFTSEVSIATARTPRTPMSGRSTSPTSPTSIREPPRRFVAAKTASF